MYGHSWLFDVVYRFLICLQLLNTEAPDLYIRQNPVPNAYTLAINGKKPFIVVHTSLVELLTPRELQVMLFTLNKLIGWYCLDEQSKQELLFAYLLPECIDYSSYWICFN